MLALTVSACGSEQKPLRIVKPSDDATAMEMMYPDGSVSEPCVVSERYLSDRKACNADQDCEQFTFAPVCCKDVQVVGVTREGLAEVEACAKANTNVCVCAPGLKRAEDGRVVTSESPATAQCIDNQCVTRVAERDCGATKHCGAGEICVSYENVPDGIPPDPDSRDNALLTFRCEPNPCEGRLSCDCATSLCRARNDAERNCEITMIEDADLTCNAYED